MNRRPFALVATLLLMLATSSSVWAEVRASLDRNRIYEGDTLTLTIEVDGITGQQPDLSALRQDFDVMGTTSGTQVSIVNGRRSDTTRWQVTLAPRRTGKIQIPALTVGNERTSPLTLTVADASAIPQRDEQVLVELEADLPSGAAYVQQQVPLTVRLYSAVPLRQGTLSDPRADHAVVERLGQDKRYTTERGGMRYQVIERHYALSPEQSGPLHIPPVVFQGNLPAERGSRSSRQKSPFDRFRNDPFFDRFFDDSMVDRLFNDDPFAALEPGRPVAVRSRDLDIEVKPRPDTAGSRWLPAEDLVLEDSWAGKVPALRVGEPTTRTLTLRARGLSGSQIPHIPLAAGDAVRVYPEAPRNDTRTDGSLIYGTSEQAFVLIPERAGELRLPEIRVHWWDTQANQEREAIVPAIEVRVQPGVNGETNTQPAQPPVAESKPEPAPKQAPAPENPNAPGSLPTPWLLGALVAALALMAAIAVWLWRRRGRSATVPAKKVEFPRPDPGPARRAFVAACDANDTSAAARHLLAWAAAEWAEDPPRNLTALAADLAQRGEAVLALDRALYAGENAGWEGIGLKQALAQGLRRQNHSEQPPAEGLAPLYPRRA